MNKLNQICRALIFVFVLITGAVVFGGPFWTGGGASTEWSDPGNWNRHDWDDYNITSDAGATSYDITFNRDGRIYRQASGDEMNAWQTTDWDYYWIYHINIHKLSNDILVRWIGENAECGPHIERYDFILLKELL